MSTVEISPWATIRRGESPDSAGSNTQYSLGTLLLVMTLVAVAFAVMRWVPALGVAILLGSVPALFRTAVVWRQRYRGGVMPAVARVREFLLGLAAVIGFGLVLAVGVLIVFLATAVLAFWAAAACCLALLMIVTLGPWSLRDLSMRPRTASPRGCIAPRIQGTMIPCSTSNPRAAGTI